MTFVKFYQNSLKKLLKEGNIHDISLVQITELLHIKQKITRQDNKTVTSVENYIQDRYNLNMTVTESEEILKSIKKAEENGLQLYFK